MPQLIDKFIFDVANQYEYILQNGHMNNKNISYIKHDIDFTKLKINQIGGSNTEKYYNKYIKYKKKYLLEKLKTKNTTQM